MVLKDIYMTYIHTIQHMGDKIIDILKYPLSWLAGIILFIGNAFAGSQFILYIVIIASVIDLICGIAVAVKRKGFTYSELMRQTVEKLTVYGAALLIFLCIDYAIQDKTGFSMDISSGIVGIVITLVETWSFSAALLILFPKNALLRLLQKALTGEIASKLGVNEKEVSAILDGMVKKSNAKKQPRNKNGQFTKKNV